MLPRSGPFVLYQMEVMVFVFWGGGGGIIGIAHYTNLTSFFHCSKHIVHVGRNCQSSSIDLACFKLNLNHIDFLNAISRSMDHQNSFTYLVAVMGLIWVISILSNTRMNLIFFFQVVTKN